MSASSNESIAQQLRRVHDEMRNDDVEFATVSNNNVVIAASGDTPPAKLQDVISAFAEAHPSRFFVIVSDDRSTALATSVSAMCHSLGGKHKVCSEIISCTAPLASTPQIPSLIQAHQLSGRLTELYIVDETVPAKLFLPLAHLSDVVYLDSHSLLGGLEGVHQIYQRTARVIDLSWMRLSCWRDAVKSAFDRQPFSGLVGSIKKITLRFSPEGDAKVSQSSLLLAGWFLTRLGGEIESIQGASVTFRLSSGISSVIQIENYEMGKSPSRGEVLIEFSGPRAITLSINLDNSGALRTHASSNPPIDTVQMISAEDQRMLLIKHFLIGESVSNYWSSLSSAIRIYDRMRG